MPDTKPNDRPSRRDEILDALADILAEKLDDRTPKPAQAIRPAQPARSAQGAPRPAAPKPNAQPRPKPTPEQSPPKLGEPGWKPPPVQGAIGLDRALGRMLLLVLALTVLLNIPVTRHGVALARILPDSAALVIRDGLILKGDGPEIYRLEDEKLRWISSMLAFEHLGLTWEDVHEVDDAFLDRFERGRPIHVLLKCESHPHIYRIEGDQKRWIKDIPTFEAEGHVWEDVRIVPCHELRAIPDGPPIPKDAGLPPQL